MMSTAWRDGGGHALMGSYWDLVKCMLCAGLSRAGCCTVQPAVFSVLQRVMLVCEWVDEEIW